MNFPLDGRRILAAVDQVDKLRVTGLNCLKSRKRVMGEMEAMYSVLGENRFTVSARPTPGSFYRIQKGDTLLRIAGESYKVDAGTKERLCFAKEINRHPLNQKYIRKDKTTPLFPEGLISFYPQFACESESLLKSKCKPPHGECFAVIWIPPKQSGCCPVSQDSAELSPDESGLEQHESDFGSQATQEKTRWYQAILKYALGNTSVPIDGNHNNVATRNALKSFQQKHDLKRKDGYLGVDTNYALMQIALQSIHNAFIVNPFGKSTSVLKEQIKRFQHDFKLIVDGKVGEKTRITMVDVLAGKMPRLHLLSEQFGVVGSDDRKPERDTLKEPNRWICKISVNNRCAEITQSTTTGKVSEKKCTDLSVTSGTGTLISPRHVLTVAHTLSGYSNADKKPFEIVSSLQFIKQHLTAKEISVSPAYNGAFGFWGRSRVTQPYGQHRVNVPYGPYTNIKEKHYWLLDCYELKSDGIVTGFNSFCDIALIELDTPVDSLSPHYKRLVKGKRTSVKLPPLGYWGVNDKFRIGPVWQSMFPTGIFTIGYPGTIPITSPRQKKKHMQWKATGNTAGDEPSSTNQEWFIFHTADTTSGQSGSPVWIQVQNEDDRSWVKSMIGVILGSRKIPGKPESNVAVALTPSILQKIASVASDTFEYEDPGRLKVKK